MREDKQEFEPTRRYQQAGDTTQKFPYSINSTPIKALD
jgi:hypothetical protein